jgi:hypothetical protein
VPTALLEQGARLRSTVFQIGSVVGRSLSGFVYALGVSLGLGVAFTYGVVLALLLTAVLATLAITYTPRPAPAAGEPMLRSLTNGVRFVFGSRILVGAMLLDLLGVLFGDAIILLPFFADLVLHVGPQGLGLLRAAPSVGAVLMAVMLARRPSFTHAGATLLCAVGGFGLAQAGFGLSPWVALSAACLIASGALDFISVLMRGAMVQVLTPPHLMGRVMSVQQVFIWSSNELGAFEAGFAARLLGLVPSVVVGGGITILVTAATAWLNPTLRRLGRITPEGVALAAAGTSAAAGPQESPEPLEPLAPQGGAGSAPQAPPPG